jgi:23S rRNA pseudouridine2605 synthase
MCAAVGHQVRALRRVAFGPLALGDLPEGAYRRVRRDELERLRAAARELGSEERAAAASGCRLDTTADQSAPR